jgi:hypothetical protein
VIDAALETVASRVLTFGPCQFVRRRRNIGRLDVALEKGSADVAQLDRVAQLSKKPMMHRHGSERSCQTS